MKPNRLTLPRLVPACVALAAVGVATLVLLPAPLLAQGGPAVQPPAGAVPGQPADQALAQGAKYFDDAIRYVARGQRGIPSVRDFYAKLDARLALDNTQHEGLMRLWFQAPDKYRQELTANRATTTKILNGQHGWIMTATGRVQNLLLTADGRKSIEQLKEDRNRLYDITQFLTLQALKGPGVTFRYEGFKDGSGTYAGKWIKVVRLAPGKSNITFWLAYAQNPQTNQVQATWPGIVRVDGDPAKGYPTEDYILKEWDSPRSQQSRTFRYPRKIEAYSILADQQGRPRPTRFLFAIVDDIKMNAGIDQSRFQRPGQRAPQPGVPRTPQPPRR